MDNTEIVRYKDYLLNNLGFHGEYDEATGIKRNILLVEGSTDVAFLENIKREETKVCSVADIMRSRAAFSSSSSPEQIPYNSKLVIMELIKHISLIPESIQCPKGADKWPLFGLVDRDFDDGGDYSKYKKLFFTDSHDLETLMLSTDAGLLSRLEQCDISEENLRIALYLSVQLAEYRKAIQQDNNLKSADISEQDGTVDFESFTEEGYTIDLGKLLSHINSKSDEPLSKGNLKKVHQAITVNMRKLLDREGKWKKKFDSFTVDLDGDLWKSVNGHDILSAIRYVNPQAREAFDNSGGHRQNRDFESALIKAYDYKCFKDTELFLKLNEAGLLREDIT